MKRIEWAQYRWSASLDRLSINSRLPINGNPIVIITIAIFAALLRELYGKAAFIADDFIGNQRGSFCEEEFTRKVKSGIKWINDCFANYSIPNRTCLYDKPEVTSNKWHPDVSWHPVVRIRAGLYSFLLRDWFSVFPRDQFYFSTLEHYSKHRVSVLNDIFQFLGVSKTNKIGRGSKRSNKHRKIKISNETMQLIDEFYRPYNEQLAVMLNDRKYNW